MAESAEIKHIVLPKKLEMTYIVCSECGVEVDKVENDDGLAEKIVAKNVPDRDKKTYECRNGHNKGLEIA